MLKKIIKIGLLLVGVLYAPLVYADGMRCLSSRNVPYCEYTGKVDRTYINENNIILIYLKTPFSPSLAVNAGIAGVTQGSAVAYSLNINADFGKLLYSTVLTAQVTNRSISIQMQKTHGGYLRVENIWLRD